MYWKITKLIITTILIVLVSEVSKRSIIIGGLIAALPLVSILSMIWMHLDGVDLQVINAFSRSVFWMTLPSIPMLYIFPIFSQKWGFNIAFFTLIGITILLYTIMISVLSKWGVNFSI